MIIAYGDKCRSQVEVVGIFIQKYPDLPRTSHKSQKLVMLGKQNRDQVEDNVKVNILLINRIRQLPLVKWLFNHVCCIFD